MSLSMLVTETEMEEKYCRLEGWREQESMKKEKEKSKQRVRDRNKITEYNRAKD